MKRSFFIFAIVLFAAACNIKKEHKQENLNDSIGWGSENPNDYQVLFTRWNQVAADSGMIGLKRKLDEAVLKELTSKNLGNQAENDDSTEIDMHFIVSKDYQNALSSILSVSETFNAKEKVTIYLRKYKSFETWDDQVIYPK